MWEWKEIKSPPVRTGPLKICTATNPTSPMHLQMRCLSMINSLHIRLYHCALIWSVPPSPHLSRCRDTRWPWKTHTHRSRYTQNLIFCVSLISLQDLLSLFSLPLISLLHLIPFLVSVENKSRKPERLFSSSAFGQFLLCCSVSWSNTSGTTNLFFF